MNIITREELKEKEACIEGLVLFDKLAIDGKLELSTTQNAEHVLRNGGHVYWEWLRENFATPSLYHANLRGANLSGADLRGANLRDADLRDADLRGANLHGANLHGADLSDAYLRDANLSDADLRDANLHGADLSDAIGYTP